MTKQEAVAVLDRCPDNLALGLDRCGNEGVVCGPVCNFTAGGARGANSSGGHTREVLLDLENSVYTQGGYQFNPCTFGLGNVTMIDTIGGLDPLCDKICPVGVQFVLDCVDPCKPRILVYNEDGEVADGWVPAGDCKQVWLRFYGMCM